MSSPPYVQWLCESGKIIVSGSGEFPFDMLRRSCAWPSTTADAVKLGQAGTREVMLTVNQRRFINHDRWESFGWPVTKEDQFLGQD